MMRGNSCIQVDLTL